MKNIILIACCSQKSGFTCAARDLYTSDLFVKSRAWAEREIIQGRASAWYILSAKHGITRPWYVLEPYDVTLADMTTYMRTLWTANVFAQLEVLQPTALTILAGEKYREVTEAWAEHRQIPHAVPLKGLGIGRQKAWLKRAVAA